MRANKDFEGSSDGSQLSFKSGDIIFIQSGTAQNGWVKAKLGGKEGIVPLSHIQEVSENS